MKKNDLIKELSIIKNAKRIYRESTADFIIQHKELFPYLLEIVFDKNSKFSIKAAWVLEIVCLEDISFLFPHLEYFTRNLKKVSDESALRPLAKVCAFLINSYYSNKKENTRTKLTKTQKERIIENSFDWLIVEHKVATQVFAMDTLFLLGKEFVWIHEELKLILQKNTSVGSAGYQAHARIIFKKI
jgi:hypothetical protein